MKITMEQVTIHILDRPELLGLVVKCRECKYYYPQNRGGGELGLRARLWPPRPPGPRLLQLRGKEGKQWMN